VLDAVWLEYGISLRIIDSHQINREAGPGNRLPPIPAHTSQVLVPTRFGIGRWQCEFLDFGQPLLIRQGHHPHPAKNERRDQETTSWQ
jgi:hypothetical protein